MRDSKNVLRLGRRWRMVFLIFALLPGALAFTGLTPTPAAAVPVVVIDDGGPDDEPGQKDLNQLTTDVDSASADIVVTWNWDVIAVSGNNTGDACSLYDTDGDGMANFSLCVIWGSNAVYQTTRLYSCGDGASDRCNNPRVVLAQDLNADGDLLDTGEALVGGPYSSTCSLSVVNDTFGPRTGAQASTTSDTQATCLIELDDFGGGDAFLLNVCSYPSQVPGSNPSDCVVNPNSGFLTIVKVADPNDGTPFRFDLGAGQAANNGDTSFTINGSGTTNQVGFAVGTGYDLTEIVPPGFELESAQCLLSNGTATGTLSVNTMTDFEIQTGRTTTCTFTNGPALEPPDIELAKTANPASVDEPGGLVTFEVQVTNNGGPGTIDSLVDDVHGDLAASCLDGGGDALVGQPIDTGQTLTCTFTADVTGNPGQSETDTVTGVVSNDAGSDTASDTATVTINNVPSAIEIIKTASPDVVDEPGGIVTFDFVINNLSATDEVTIDTLGDTVYGDLNGQGDCSVPQTIAAGGSYTCSFAATVNGNAGESETNIVTASGTDDDGVDVSDTDDATVTVNDVPSSIAVSKTASPTSVDEPGGDVTYTFTVDNTSAADSVTINSFDDSIYGNLDGEGNCSVPQTIAAGDSYSCSITRFVSGSPGQTISNLLTVAGEDDDGNPVGGSDDADVTIDDVPSIIAVTKSASPTSVPESGGDVTYTFVVNNDSAVDSVTIDTLSDSIYGNLDGEGNCSVPQTVAAGDSYSCSITETVTGQAGDTITNIVTASGIDDDGNPVSESGTADVTITDVPSSIAVEKTASPTSVPEPGGDVTFTFVVDNTSLTDDVTINSLSDSVYGDLNGQGDCSTPQAIAAGASYSCSITVFVAGNANEIVPNVLTVSGIDDDGNPVDGSDDASVEITDVPSSISVDKTASPTSVPETGADVTYTVVVTNTSEVDTVTINQVIDDRVGDVSALCDGGNGLPVDLAPTESVTCVFSDFVSGDTGATYTNLATALGTDDDGQPVQGDDSETVTFDDVPASIEITKTANPTTVDEPGGDVTFTFVVNNTSAVDLVTINSLQDSVYGDITTVPGSDCVVPQILPVDGSYSCSFTVFVAGNANDFETNVVTATGIDDDDEPVTAEDDATVTINDVPSSILTTKTASPSSVPESGADVTFTIEVKNTSTVDSVTIDTVTDSVFGDVSGSCVPALPAVLLPGQTISCSFTEFISGDFPDSHLNVATASGEDDDGNPVSDDGEADVPFNDVFPEITVTKTAAPTSVPETGGDVTFTFVATNNATEDATLDSMVDSDFGDLNNQGDCVVPQPLAANGGSYSCSITVSLSGDAGGPAHNNVVTATASDDEGNEATADDDETVNFDDVLPDVSITKTADPIEVPETGADVEFTLVVTNNSAEDATIDSMVDSDFDLADTCSDAAGTALGTGATYICVFTEFVEGDASGPPHQNTATVVASDGDGNTDTASDDAEVGFVNVEPTITVTKTPDPASVPETGAPVEFTVVVTNTSEENVTITALTDSDFDLSTECGDAVGTELTPGATYTCDFIETIAGDAGGPAHENTVTANAVDNDDSPAEASGTATVTFTDVLPDISVVKNANPTSVPETGGDVTYTVEVTNNSTEAATLDGLLDDTFGSLAGQGDCVTGGTVAPLDTYSCSFTIVGLAGEPSTPHTNIVTATASDDDGNSDTDTGEATVTFTNVLPDISITKTANPTSVDEPGADVEFTIVVVNNSLEDARIDTLVDTDFPFATNCPDAVGTVLGFNESYTCVFTEFVGGNVGEDHENTATVVASDNDGSFDTEFDTATVSIDGVDPDIEVVKDGPPTINEGGDTATYMVRITNNSVSSDPVTITSLIDDPFGDLLPDVEAENGGPITIAPGESFAFIFERELTLDGGEEHSNVITACGGDDEGVEACDDDDHTVTGENVEPLIAVDKTGPTNVDEGGDTATYTVTITNNSASTDPVTITSLEDDKFGNLLPEAEAANGDSPILLAPDASFTFDFTRDIDLGAGEIHTNTVTAVGTDDEGSIDDDSDDHTVTAVDVAPVLNIEKTGSDTVLEGGDTATYTITIRNDSAGTDPVTITSLMDDKFGDLLAEAEAINSDNPIVLQPGQEFTFSFDRDLTLDGGEIHTNVAEVCGIDDEDTEDCDEDDHPVTGGDVEPQMVVTKTPDQGEIFAPGEDVTFTIRVENTSVSTDPLTITSIDDDVFGDVSAECALPQTIDAGTAFECNITRDITADHTNTATVEAEDDEGTEISADASASVEVINPSLAIEKSTNVLDADSAPGPEILVGGAVTWTYAVTNNGDVLLTGIEVADDILGSICTIATLAVGATETCSIDGVAVEGPYLNVGTASVSYTDADGDTAERSDSDPSNYFGANPSLTISKTFADDTVTAGGAGSSFDLVVTNDGNVDLTGVSITDVVDDRLTVTGVSGAGADCSASSGQNIDCVADLESGESVTITVDFSVAADVAEADDVSNTATVANTYTDGAGNTADLSAEATDTIDIEVDIDLSIVKTFDPSEATPGTTQSFTLLVTNSGSSDAVDVSVTDVVADLLPVTAVSVTAGTGDCAASSGQSVDCTVQVPAGESVTITVDYVVVPFLDTGSGNLGGDDFRFVFVNGSVLEGSTATGKVFLDGVDVSDDATIVTGLSRNDVVFDPPGPDPAFELHLSCSDSFTGGWGQSGGPVEGVDTNWQIGYFSIVRYNNNGFIKACGDVTTPFDVFNEATASAEGSSGTETATGSAVLTIAPGITVDRLQTNGKRLTAYLTNGTSGKTIEEITVGWPDSNGDLTRVRLDDSTVWQGSDDPPDAALGAADTGWNGGTLATGESVLRLDFKNKAAKTGYTVQVTFTDGTVLDISQ